MRGFFILLLITNLLFFSWQLWFAPESEPPPRYAGIPLVNEGLQLLSELDEKDRPAHREFVTHDEMVAESLPPVVELITASKPAEQLTATSSSDSKHCYQSSPLVTLKEARALQQSLLELGISKTRRETIQTHKVNYWVMLKGYKSREKADEAAELLKSHKVKDFFIVRSGRYENSVSLGVFSTKERADKRYKQIVQLKLRLRKPLIEALELPAKRLVVGFELDNAITPDGLSPLLDATKEPHLKKIHCN